MAWRFFLSIGLALAYLAWIWKDRRGNGRVGTILGLIGSAGILVHLTCAYISTLPSHTPLSTITGLATNRSFLWFDHSHSDFILVEEGTGRRALFTTSDRRPLGRPAGSRYLRSRWQVCGKRCQNRNSKRRSISLACREGTCWMGRDCRTEEESPTLCELNRIRLHRNWSFRPNKVNSRSRSAN